MRRSAAGATLAALALLILVLSIGSVRLDTATADEPAHLAAGMIKLVDGRLDFFREQPPLMNSLSALPVVLAGYKMPPVWTASSNHWEVGRYLLYRTGYDAHRMLFLARLPTIAMFLALWRGDQQSPEAIDVRPFPLKRVLGYKCRVPFPLVDDANHAQCRPMIRCAGSKRSNQTPTI